MKKSKVNVNLLGKDETERLTAIKSVVIDYLDELLTMNAYAQSIGQSIDAPDQRVGDFITVAIDGVGEVRRHLYHKFSRFISKERSPHYHGAPMLTLSKIYDGIFIDISHKFGGAACHLDELLHPETVVDKKHHNKNSPFGAHHVKNDLIVIREDGKLASVEDTFVNAFSDTFTKILEKYPYSQATNSISFGYLVTFLKDVVAIIDESLEKVAAIALSFGEHPDKQIVETTGKEIEKQLPKAGKESVKESVKEIKDKGIFSKLKAKFVKGVRAFIEWLTAE